MNWTWVSSVGEQNRNKDSLYELDLGEYSVREENRNKDSLYELDLGE